MNKNIYFETIKCDDFEIYNIEYHNKRVAKTIGLNIDLNEYIYPVSNRLLKCKIIYNDYEITDVSYDEYKTREISSFKIVYDDTIEYSKKYFDRSELDRLYAKKESCDEIIIIKNGFVTDTSIANIAIFDNGNWITPKTPLLEGTCRARLIEQKALIPKDITLKMLQNAKKIALMNAMIGFKTVDTYSFLL